MREREQKIINFYKTGDLFTWRSDIVRPEALVLSEGILGSDGSALLGKSFKKQIPPAVASDFFPIY